MNQSTSNMKHHHTGIMDRRTTTPLSRRKGGKLPWDDALQTSKVTRPLSATDLRAQAEEYFNSGVTIVGAPGLDETLSRETPQDDVELAFWLHICLERNGLIPPFALKPNDLQPEHSYHFKFIADQFFERTQDCILLGSRFSGKTLAMATLLFLDAIFKPGIELSHLAAVKDQAYACYDYILRFLRHPLFSHHVDAKKMTMQRCQFKNGSMIKILIGTVAGVNSSHSTKISIDEVELMNWEVLQEAMNIATSGSKMGALHANYKQATRLTSTRKYSTGTMQKMIDESKERGFTVYQWNVWDAVQRCHMPDGCTKYIPVPDMLNRQKIMNVPETCLECPMMQVVPPRCLGKARYSHGGVIQLDDIHSKVRNLDLEIWIAQHECTRPGKKDLIYTMFSKNRHIVDYEKILRELGMDVAYASFPERKNSETGEGASVAYCPTIPVYAAQDAGYTCPATIFVQEIEDVLYVFDEIRVERIAPSIYIQDFLITAHDAYDVDYFICDPSGLTLLSDMEVAGFCCIPAENKLDEGIEAVKSRLGANQLYFDKSCTYCASDLSKYARDNMGTIRRKTLFHFADCIRYLCMEFVNFGQVLDKVYT